MKYLDFLLEAIQKVHGCEADHVESVPVLERFQGQTVWEGTVEVFEIAGHPRATFCYAWGFEDDSGKIKAVAVLAVPPINNEADAVRAFIASTARGNHAES
jgi:hypothetical protein